MINLFPASLRIILLATVVFSPPHTLTEASGKTVSEKPTVNTSALAELRQAVGAAATVTPAKGGAVAFQQATFRKRPLPEVSFGSSGVTVVWPNKRRVVFHNVHPHTVDDESKVITHRYGGTEPLTGLLWITKDRYEHTEQLLTSQANEKVTEVANEPQINRSGTLLFAKQNDCFVVSEDCHPGFQLWRINKGTLKLVKEVRLQNYFVVNGGWVSATTVRLEVASLQEMMSGRTVATLKRQFFDVTIRQ